MIKLDSVSKEYPRSGMVLKEVSFHIRKGELVFLTGHSGSGKSTILRLVQMADAPTAGEVRVSGFSSKRLRRREIPYLRRKVGMVFQEFRLLPGRTAEENIAFALEVTGTRRAAITQKVGRLMAQVGLAAKARAYPEELSGGERQRVAVARALANDPLVLLADEPTGNLDEWSARGIFQLFREINASGMTVLMATHDLDLVRSHPQYRVLELSAGELAYDSALEPAAQGG
ncbi:MAG: cell division ATP-binding protein FtsE [Gemmatimonadetes bacterium]|nr:cell division ATP-binding protein FtsE [Gemmatimonadota bacterium]